MSQLLAPTHTYADNIPLGRRIAEIMQEKGSAYTIAAMSKRLGINRETLRLMLKGEREIYTFELEKIAKDLKLPVERILQADIYEEYQQMQELHWSRADNKLAFEIAQLLLRVAIGITEKCMAVNHLALSHYALTEFSTAREWYEIALRDGKIILEKWGEYKQFFTVTLNLISCMNTQRSYIGVRQLIEDAKPYVVYESNLRAPALLFSLDAKLKEEWEGDLEGARDCLYKSNDYYQRLGHPFSLARSQHRLAVFEYRQQNFIASNEFFQLTWKAFQELKDHYHHVVNGRDFGKLLIRMNDFPQAVEILRNCIATIHANPKIDWRHLEADLYLLDAITEQKPMLAEKVVEHELGSISTRKLARKFVLEYYERIGNETSKIAFEKRIPKLPTSPIDMLLNLHQHNTDALLTLIDFVHLHGWNAVDLQKVN